MNNQNYQDFLKNLGKKIKEIRTSKKITQTEMEVGDFGIEYKFYQRIEAGKSINLQTFYKVCKRLDIHPKEIFNDFDF